MELSEVLKQRYSVRNFSNKEIESDKLNKILKAGILAPTAKNYQPQKIYVIKSKEALEKANSVTKCIYGATTVLLACYDKNISWKNSKSGEDSGVEDVSIACTHIMLEAWNQGVGSCWVNLFDSNEVRRIFKLEENIVPVCFMPLGYLSQDAKPNEILHFSYRDKREIYKEI